MKLLHTKVNLLESEQLLIAALRVLNSTLIYFKAWLLATSTMYNINPNSNSEAIVQLMLPIMVYGLNCLQKQDIHRNTDSHHFL